MTPIVRESAGRLLGVLAAPFFATVSFARHARTFHPDGLVFLVNVAPHPDVTAANRGLAARLEGPALTRVSGALWRGGFEHLDVLGLALRFRRNETETPEPEGDDQDLLFATIRSPFTMPLSPFTTRTGDYLANVYYAVSPFTIGGGRNVKLRLVPEHGPSLTGRSRNERLRLALDAGTASFRLDVRNTFNATWSPVSTVALAREVSIDQEALRFSPFRTGRGVVPRGLVHAMRKAAYPASQSGRALSRILLKRLPSAD